jgi:hypothetical protein
MDQSEYIFLDVPNVRRLIAEKEKTDKYRIDELVVAVFLANFCERIWKTECDIGFPLKNSEARLIPSISKSDLKEVKDILNAKTEQDHDIDVVIVHHTPNNSKRAGQGFQIKRFNTHHSIDPKKFPFAALYLIGLYGDKLRFIEAWPNLGKEEVEWSSV